MRAQISSIHAKLGRKIVLVVVMGDREASDEFHHEVWQARIGSARIEHFGDIGVIHHRQRLSFGLEAGDDLLRIHAQRDDS